MAGRLTKRPDAFLVVPNPWWKPWLTIPMYHVLMSRKECLSVSHLDNLESTIQEKKTKVNGQKQWKAAARSPNPLTTN